MSKSRFEYHMAFGGCRDKAKKHYPPHPGHVATVKEIVKAITEPDGIGYFVKEDVMVAAGIHAIDQDNINWEFILRHLKEHYDATLIPLAKHFFKTHKVREYVTDANGKTTAHNYTSKPISKAIQEAQNNGDRPAVKILAGRALASGNGKKTVGYACVSLENAGLTIALLRRKDATANGVIDARNTFATHAEGQKVLITGGEMKRLS